MSCSVLVCRFVSSTVLLWVNCGGGWFFGLVGFVLIGVSLLFGLMMTGGIGGFVCGGCEVMKSSNVCWIVSSSLMRGLILLNRWFTAVWFLVVFWLIRERSVVKRLMIICFCAASFCCFVSRFVCSWLSCFVGCVVWLFGGCFSLLSLVMGCNILILLNGRLWVSLLLAALRWMGFGMMSSWCFSRPVTVWFLFGGRKRWVIDSIRTVWCF